MIFKGGLDKRKYFFYLLKLSIVKWLWLLQFRKYWADIFVKKIFPECGNIFLKLDFVSIIKNLFRTFKIFRKGEMWKGIIKTRPQFLLRKLIFCMEAMLVSNSVYQYLIKWYSINNVQYCAMICNMTLSNNIFSAWI